MFADSKRKLNTTPDRPEIAPEQQPHINRKSFEPVTPSKFLPTIDSNKKRIGILRRPEGYTPPLDSTQFSLQKPVIELNSYEQPSPLENPNIVLNIERCESRGAVDSDNLAFHVQNNELQLKAPESVPLKSSFLKENETQTSIGLYSNENKQEKMHQTDIPYWLRPSPVQLYPYNFIMAVRKKLEAITNPVLITKFQPQDEKIQRIPDQFSHESPIARPNTIFSSKYHRNLDRRQSESDKSMTENENPKSSSIENQSDNVSNDASPVKISNLLVHSSEPEEYSMNFTSATNPSKQTDIQTKSRRKHMKGSQDTLSISSGILSHSSPEKKASDDKDSSNDKNKEEIRQPSPLNTDHVDGLQITSRKQDIKSISQEKTAISNGHSKSIATATSFINFNRGKDFSSVDQFNFKDLNDAENVQKLLHDFNESLSQVIKVNKRLRKVLSNPPSSRYSDSRQQSAKYRDDFESKQSSIEQINTLASSSVPSYKSLTKTDTNHRNSNGNTSTIIKTIEELSNHISTEISIKSSTRNYDKSTVTNESEVSTQRDKDSSTQINEEIPATETSESPTNNDLKSVTLSIAKRSITTDDDVDTKQRSSSSVNESIHKHISGDPETLNQSIGSDIFAVFNQSGMLDAGKDLSWSEHNISYSSLGMVIKFYLFFSLENTK